MPNFLGETREMGCREDESRMSIGGGEKEIVLRGVGFYMRQKIGYIHKLQISSVPPRGGGVPPHVLNISSQTFGVVAGQEVERTIPPSMILITAK